METNGNVLDHSIHINENLYIYKYIFEHYLYTFDIEWPVTENTWPYH